MNSQPPPDLLHPGTGDALWFERIPRSPTDPLVFRCRLPARSPGTPMHFHPAVDEAFHCLAGELDMCLDSPRHPIRLRPGEHADVPRGRRHRFWNASDLPVLFRSTVSPGLDFCRFLESYYGIGIEGRAAANGMPRSLLQLAVIRQLADLHFAGVPLLVQRPLFAGLSLLARLAGTRRRMQRHWSFSQPPHPGRSTP